MHTSPSAVVLDVDGTLAGADHRVSPRTLELVAEFERRGVPVVLASGRSEANVARIAAGARLRTPFVSCSGALVTDPGTGERLRVRPIDPVETATMLELHHSTGYAFTWWTATGIFVTSAALQAALAGFGDPGVVLSPTPPEPPADALKVMLFGSAAELDLAAAKVLAALPRATRPMDTFWELSAPDADKWAAISWVLDRLGRDPAGTVGLGDGGNDVTWMRRIGNPVAMANARPEVHAVATAVAGYHAHDGAADYLEKILRKMAS
jgi:hypothetical protein